MKFKLIEHDFRPTFLTPKYIFNTHDSQYKLTTNKQKTNWEILLIDIATQLSKEKWIWNKQQSLKFSNCLFVSPSFLWGRKANSFRWNKSNCWYTYLFFSLDVNVLIVPLSYLWTKNISFHNIYLTGIFNILIITSQSQMQIKHMKVPWIIKLLPNLI